MKWLDCQERLSLQVHPPEELAEKLGGEPKTENWYVVDSSKNSDYFLDSISKSQSPNLEVPYKITRLKNYATALIQIPTIQYWSKAVVFMQLTQAT